MGLTGHLYHNGESVGSNSRKCDVKKIVDGRCTCQCKGSAIIA